MKLVRKEPFKLIITDALSSSRLIGSMKRDLSDSYSKASQHSEVLRNTIASNFSAKNLGWKTVITYMTEHAIYHNFTAFIQLAANTTKPSLWP